MKKTECEVVEVLIEGLRQLRWRDLGPQTINYANKRPLPIFPPMKRGEPIEITPEARAEIDGYLEDLRAWVYREHKITCPECGASFAREGGRR